MTSREREISCPNCQGKGSENFRFCPHCGLRLGEYASRLDYRLVAQLHPVGPRSRRLDHRPQMIEGHDQDIDTQPNNAETYRSRGIAYADLGQAQRAIQDLSTAIGLNPVSYTHLRAHETLR